MTNEELNTIETAARKADLSTILNKIGEATCGNPTDSYAFKAAITQIIQSGLYPALDAFIAKEIIPTDLYDVDRFDTSIIAVLIKPNLSPEESWDAYVQWLSTYLDALDDINEEIASTTLVEYAIQAGAPIAILNALADAGAEVNRSDAYGRTLLYKIAEMRMLLPQQTLELVNWLLAQGADPNVATVERKTALHAAINAGKAELIEPLLAAGADPNISDWNGQTAFYNAAVEQGNTHMVETLLSYHRPDFHLLSKQGENLLNAYLRSYFAERESGWKIVNLLLQHGADLISASLWYQKEKTGVDWLVEKHSELLMQVVDAGYLDPYYQDDLGNTLLHKVCQVELNYEEAKAKDMYKKVKYLLRQEVDPQIQNTEDKRAVDYAMGDNLKSKVVELLLK